jgi:hypothetical protein
MFIVNKIHRVLGALKERNVVEANTRWKYFAPLELLSLSCVGYL